MMSTNLQKIDLKRVLIYCAFAFGLSWPIALVIYQNGGLSNSVELAPGVPLYMMLLLGYMATPALAHILTRLVTREGWKNLGLRPKVKQGWRSWLAAWFGPVVLILLGTAVFYLIFPQYFDPKLGRLAETLEASGVSTSGLGITIQMLLVMNVIQAVFLSPLVNALPVLGEEFGWRAYLQPKLMPLSPRKALVITGIIWGLWHAPIIAMGYNYGNFEQNTYFGAPWNGILMMTLASIWLGIFLGWLTIKGKSVWPAVIAHGSLNGLAAVSLYLSQGEPPLLLGPTALGVIGGAGFILAAVVLYLTPKALEPAAEPEK
jgi:membrane protease YdiL (CAAX protease family)